MKVSYHYINMHFVIKSFIYVNMPYAYADIIIPGE